MGRPQTDDRRCKWHPKHKQSTGVCPFCVREKLQQLTASPFSACSSYNAYVFSSTASSSPCSDESDASSSAASPQRHLRYIDIHVKSTRASHLVKGEVAESGKLKKSRSLVFNIGEHNELVMEERNKKGKEKEKEEKRSKKKGRFWAKLLLSGSKRREREEAGGAGAGRGALRYSQTFKENASTAWAL